MGMGTAMSNTGFLAYMPKSAISSGLPDSEQTRGMASSLYIVCFFLGGYIGATVGGYVAEYLSFTGTMMTGAAGIGVSLVVSLGYIAIIWCKIRSGKSDKRDEINDLNLLEQTSQWNST